MKKIVLFVLVMVGLPALTEAQSRRYYEVRNTIYGHGYGYPSARSRYGYDPYYDELVRLPGNLVACQMDFDNGKVTSCHPLVKTVEFLEEHGYSHQNRNELVGTSRIIDDKPHFCSFDDTNRRLGTGGGMATGAVIGAAGGGAATGNRRSALGGAAIGVAIGGLIGSRNAHENCMPIGTTEVKPEASATPAPEKEQAATEAEEVVSNKGPAYRPGNRIVSNNTKVPVELYDGSVAPENLVGEIAPSEEWSLAKPKTRYRALAQIPNSEGGITADELALEPSASGWRLNNPNFGMGD